MTRRIHLWPEGNSRRDDKIEAAAVLEGVRGKRTRLFFRLPVEEGSSLTEAADPFVLAISFHVMRAGADLEVHGAVSPSLLLGLDEFQTAWSRWRPDRYRRFSVSAEIEREQAREEYGRTAMMFSGGVDSCYTAWRHTRGDLESRKRRIDAAVLAHGFDIPLDQEEVFARAAARAKTILDSVGICLVPVTCNIRVLGDRWGDSHGSALAAVLHLLAGGYSTGLISSSHVYETLRFPWGSNPVTDPMLSSASLSIVHDGCDLTRWEKADEIGDWDEVQHHLRICWEGEHLDRNCGTCMRCVGTALCFAAVGRPIPPSIPVPSPGDAVERLRTLKPKPVQLGHFEDMALTARKTKIRDPWVAELAQFTRTHRRGGWGRPLRRLWRGRAPDNRPQVIEQPGD